MRQCTLLEAGSDVLRINSTRFSASNLCTAGSNPALARNSAVLRYGVAEKKGAGRMLAISPLSAWYTGIA